MFDCLWCLHDAEPRSGPLNMALDELILEHAESTARPVLRTYCWAEPFVSIGFFDRIERIEEQFPDRPLVRRWTGGGAVDHRDDFTFTLAVPGTDPSARWPAALRYTEIHARVSSALAQLGVETESAGRSRATLPGAAPAPCFAAAVCGDLLSAGRKIVGGAQRRTRAGVLHQGSMQYLSQRIDWPALAPALSAAFGREQMELALDAEWLKRGRALADSKYGTTEWLRAR
jgi:lipoyl(octanoyl) transferase